MKTILVHTLIIGSTLVGGDLTLNEGREMRALSYWTSPRAVVVEAKRKAYHFNSGTRGWFNDF